MFWFRKKHTAPPSRGLFILFLICLFFVFSVFLSFDKLQSFGDSSVEEKASVAQKLARWVDQQVGELIASATNLYRVFQSWGYILDHQKDIDLILEAFANNQTIKNNIPIAYSDLYQFGQTWLPYWEDIIDLLGPDRVRTYLVALMNTNEIRPNGWFFGSYALVQLYKGKLMQYKVFDSYYAYHQNTWVRIVLDRDYQEILGQQSINFISPNVYGFTALDAANIKTLYEQLFPWQNLDGVVMVRSDLLEWLLPGLRSKLVERQFVNASIDLIRWEALPNKKEQYLVDIGSYLESNKDMLFDQIIKNLPRILNSRYIQLYLPKSSEQFQAFLRKQGVVFTQDLDKLYIWRFNKSFNKIDNFINQKYIMQDKNGNVLYESNEDVLSITPDDWLMKNGELYELYFFYTLTVPQTYVDQLFGLSKQYNIELTQREQHILWLSFNRQNQIIVHLPEFLQFVDLDGHLFCGNESWIGNDKKCYKVIDGKHNQVVTFDVITFGNDVLKVVRMKVKKV